MAKAVKTKGNVGKEEEREVRSEVMTVAVKKQNQLLAEMTEATREVALDFRKKLQTACRGVVLIKYDIGARLVEVWANEGKYGENAPNLIAAYLDFPGGATALYKLKLLATEFTREQIVEQVGIPMDNGQSLEAGHFLCLTGIRHKEDQEKILDRVRRECLSVNQMELEVAALIEKRCVRSGGRKPQRPSSPAAGLQKLMATSLRLANFLEITEEAVFAPLEDVAADTIDDRLLKKFEQAESQLSYVSACAGDTLGRMKAVKERLMNVFALREERKSSGDSSANLSGEEALAAKLFAGEPGGEQGDGKVSGRKAAGGKKRPVAV